MSETQHEVLCPECGTPGTVSPQRRDAVDFCSHCDFPLFWTPTAIELDRDQGAAAEALRRLPGMAGRASAASVPCPTCAEANPILAMTCLRCGGPMVLPDPEPVAVVEPEPEPLWLPEPVVEPEPRPLHWSLFVLAGLTVLALVCLVVGLLAW